MSIRDLFCSVDAFWQQFEPLWEREQVAAGRRRRRATRLHPSEIMTILILFQQSGNRTFKGFSTHHVQTQLRAEFPHRDDSPGADFAHGSSGRGRIAPHESRSRRRGGSAAISRQNPTAVRS